MCDTHYGVTHGTDTPLAGTAPRHRGAGRAGQPALFEPGYGYGLLEHLQHRGFDTDANTLYPLLRRLEKQGLLTSEWNTEEARPRKFYRTSSEGDQVADQLIADWHLLNTAINRLTDGGPS